MQSYSILFNNNYSDDTTNYSYFPFVPFPAPFLTNKSGKKMVFSLFFIRFYTFFH